MDSGWQFVLQDQQDQASGSCSGGQDQESLSMDIHGLFHASTLKDS